MTREVPGIADDSGLRTVRRSVISLIAAAVLLSPLAHLLQKPLTGTSWFLMSGSIVFVGLVLWQVWALGEGGAGARTPWLTLAGIVGLAIALFVVGGQEGAWIPALAFAAALCGRYSTSPVPAVIGGATCALTGLIVAAVQNFPSGDTFSAVAFAPLAALFAYTAARRADTVDKLRRTRAELARAAVAEGRLRIARD